MQNLCTCSLRLKVSSFAAMGGLVGGILRGRPAVSNRPRRPRSAGHGVPAAHGIDYRPIRRPSVLLSRRCQCAGCSGVWSMFSSSPAVVRQSQCSSYRQCQRRCARRGCPFSHVVQSRTLYVISLDVLCLSLRCGLILIVHAVRFLRGGHADCFDCALT